MAVSGQIYSSELLALGKTLRDLYIYILAYEEVVFNPEKYLSEEVRAALVQDGTLNQNQELNIEKISRNTDLLRIGKYEYVSFEALITRVSYNIFGYLGGSSPNGTDYIASGGDNSLIGMRPGQLSNRDEQIVRFKWFEPGKPATVQKSNYGITYSLTDTKILDELEAFTEGGAKRNLIAGSGGDLVRSPFFEDESAEPGDFDFLYGALISLRQAFDSASVFATSTNFQSIEKDTPYDLFNPDLAINFNDPRLRALQEKWSSQLGSRYETENGFTLADIYGTLFQSLKAFGFNRFDGGPASETSFYHQQFLNDVEAIRKKLIAELPKLIQDRSELIQSNAIAAAIVEDPQELILEKVDPPKLTPFDFQCFLLENISKLVDQRENGAFASNYKNIVKVSNNGDPGSVINTIQHGIKSGYIREFLNICPEVYGLLTPYLKISRLEYDDVGNVKLDRNGRSIEKDLRIPNFLTQNDVQNILDGAAGRAPGAGIKSFSWALDGVQPAEVDNNISATLVMYFQSINDFFNGARSAGQDEPNFLDLIINSPGVRKLRNKQTGNEKPDEKPCSDDLLRNKLHQDYEGHNFRVKICAGWATPPIEALKQLTKNDEKAEALEKAFNDSRISLFLQMTQHQINFNQNGTLELTVSYQASLAGLLTGKTADIFDVSSKLIEQDIDNLENAVDDINESGKDLGEADKKKKKELLEEIKELKNIDRNVKYKKLLKRIFSSATPGPTVSGESRIYSISLNPNELTLTPYKDLSPTERQRRVKRRETDETFQFQSVPEFNNELLKAIDQKEAATGKETGETYSNTAVKTFDQLTDQQKINIPFFFLGDLIDTVIEEIRSNNQKNAADGAKPLNFQMFISDVEMIDPLQAFKFKNLEDLVNCGYDLKDISFIDAASKENPLDNTELNGIYRTMNIGDIPISLDAFQLWFKDNVVKSEKNTYFLLYFIKDICKDLITKALSSKCFGKEFNFQQRFDAQPLTLGLKQGKINEFISNETYPAKQVGKAQAEVRCGLDSAQTKLGLLLYSTDSRPRGLEGMKSYDSDTKRGIYHHYLGSACGLVKTINFSRQDQAYLRESRIQKEGALGAEQLRELYSADIDLVGNTLYKNGMYIYINPSLLGASQEYLDYLGLHGYYLVTSVKSTVTPSSFDVSISALHEGIEFKDNKLLPTGDVGRFFEEGFQPEDPPPDVDRRLTKRQRINEAEKEATVAVERAAAAAGPGTDETDVEAALLVELP